MKLKKDRTASVPKRARQRELDFYEHVIKDSDQVAKRKAVAKDEEDLVKRREGTRRSRSADSRQFCRPEHSQQLQ